MSTHPILCLTKREKQVIKLIGDGLTNKQIGEALGISPRTVGYFIYRASIKFGASNRTQLSLILNGVIKPQNTFIEPTQKNILRLRRIRVQQFAKQGMSKTEIANRLGMSISSVDNDFKKFDK